MYLLRCLVCPLSPFSLLPEKQTKCYDFQSTYYLIIFNMGEICMSHQWSSSSILSLYYLCSGSYDLSSMVHYGLFIPGHQVWPFQFLHKNKCKTFSLYICRSRSRNQSFLKIFSTLYHIFLPVFTSNHVTDHFW